MAELDIDQPEWPAILRAVQDQLARRIHTSLPAIVKSYDSSVQTATVELTVQLDGVTLPPLADVPVCAPGNLHAPLEDGDAVLVVFCEEDWSKWYDTGSVPSAPAVLARHGLHAIAVPGLHRAAAPLDVTAGHSTLIADELRLGSDSASDPVALKSLVETAITDLLDGIISAAGSITAPGGGPAFVAALNAFKLTWESALSVGATKVKAE